MKIFLFFSLILINLNLFNQDTYRLSYKVKFDTHGKVLFIIPFRIYFNAFASVDLQKSPRDSFRFIKINQPGYMARTLGFSGRTLGVFTADYRQNKFLPYSKHISDEIKNNESYYGKYIKKIQRYPFDLVMSTQTPFFFTRTPAGTYKDIEADISLNYRYPKVKIKTSFRIYEILTDVLHAFDHPILPHNITSINLVKNGTKWQSEPLNFSGFLNKIAKKTAKIMRLVSKFRQEKLFKLSYTAEKIKGQLIISGQASPRLKIWQNFKIIAVSRKIVFSLKNNILLLDTIYTEVKSDSGNGGTAQATLRRLSD